MSNRRVGIVRALGATLALAGLLAAVSCNDDAAKDDTAEKTTTTKDDGPTTTAPVTAPPESAPLIEVTTTTISPTQFGSTLDSVRADLTAATDLCEVVASSQNLQQAGTPSTADELKGLFVLYGDVFNKIADSLPADAADDADTIRAGAADMLTKAEASGYDPATFSGGGLPGVRDNPAMVEALTRVQGLVADCPEGG